MRGGNGRRNPALSRDQLVSLLRKWGKGENLIEMILADPEGFGAPFLLAVNKIVEKVEAKKEKEAEAKKEVEAKKVVATPSKLSDRDAWIQLAKLVDAALPELSVQQRTAIQREFLAEAQRSQ